MKDNKLNVVELIKAAQAQPFSPAFAAIGLKKGDVPGHEFHGNQWTGGGGNGGGAKVDTKIFDRANYSRKARSWKEVADEKNKKVIEEAKKLPEFPERDVYGSNAGKSSPVTTDFEIDVPQYFVLDRGTRGKYLINTEGSKYARYAVRL